MYVKRSIKTLSQNIVAKEGGRGGVLLTRTSLCVCVGGGLHVRTWM
jgi:hypothetical protein